MIEFELKYSIPNSLNADRILSDKFMIKLAGDGSSWERIVMKAVYYDTEGFLLQKKGIALRIRREGESKTATVKFAGECEKGLHQREEINFDLLDTSEDFEKDVSSKDDDEAGRVLEMFLSGRKADATWDDRDFFDIDPADIELLPFMRSDIVRHTLTVKDTDCCFEIAVDTGKIYAQGGSVHISEMELELLSGDEKRMLQIGEMIRDRFELAAENETKYSRGMKLLQGESN